MAMTDETPLARIVRFRGAVCSLAGTVPALGAVVPDFRLSRWWDAERINVTLESALAVGRPMLFSVVQSVDGHVSQVQVKTFDRQLAEFQGRVTGLQISSDLPITINRFFRQEEITHLVGLSDYYDQNFGRAYGVLIDEAKILTRAVFVADRKGVLRHAEILPEITLEPDYDAALAVLRSLVEDAPAPVAADTEGGSHEGSVS
jgi:thioredoxin-dependent peroxiredoxin